MIVLFAWRWWVERKKRKRQEELLHELYCYLHLFSSEGPTLRVRNGRFALMEKIELEFKK